MSERSERNRKIAVWLEPEPSPYFRVPSIVAKIRRSEKGAWRCIWSANEEGHGQDGKWDPLDFYASEEASAAILDKFHSMECDVEIRWAKNEHGPLVVVEVRPQSRRRFDHYICKKDRKEAIAECALRLIEETGGQR